MSKVKLFEFSVWIDGIKHKSVFTSTQLRDAVAYCIKYSLTFGVQPL